eukprot:Phypoly_transcript_18658.p1 GENE.Phypoly_transcript_18658~~Phypoly_transcript_18658.p1  ORF type:complete len:159 (+),score=32.67 Phypoly_transcript_18658:142-618(+)
MEEDWEVVQPVDEGVDWEEITRSRSRSRTRSPFPNASVTDLEAQLLEAQTRAINAELRAQVAEVRARELQDQLQTSRAQVSSLQVVVQQQRAENDNLRAAVMLSSSTEPVKPVRTRALRDKRVSRALASVAPQTLALSKRKAWGKSNHRTSTTGARHI